MLRLLLTHETGTLGPKTVDEWNTPNGEDCLLVWMLRELEKNGQRRVSLNAVEDVEGVPGYHELMLP